MNRFYFYFYSLFIWLFLVLLHASAEVDVVETLDSSGEDHNVTKIRNGCEVYERIAGTAFVNFPPAYHAFKQPWIHPGKKIKLYTSEALTYNWNWFKELKVKSLNTTLAELLSFLDKNGCLFVPYGEGVKNLFLGSIQETSPLSIEGETTCDVFQVYNLCREKYGIHLCGVQPSKAHHRVTIGVQDHQERYSQTMIDPLVVSAWNSTFNRPKSQWEFTANAVGLYDNTAGKIYLVDMLGRALGDICRHYIELPVKQERWEKWVYRNLVKLLRYYNLEAEAFYARKTVREFVLRQAKSIFSRKQFQEYYCRFVLRGFFSIYGSNAECRVIPLDSRKTRLQKIVNESLINDFGPFYEREMRPAIENMDVRNATLMDFHEGHHHRQTHSWPVSSPDHGQSKDDSGEDEAGELPEQYTSPSTSSVFQDAQVFQNDYKYPVFVPQYQTYVEATSTQPPTAPPSTEAPTTARTVTPRYEEHTIYIAPQQAETVFDTPTQSQNAFDKFVPQESEDYITYDD